MSNAINLEISTKDEFYQRIKIRTKIDKVVNKMWNKRMTESEVRRLQETNKKKSRKVKGARVVYFLG